MEEKNSSANCILYIRLPSGGDSAMGSTSRESANHVGSQSIRWDNREATRLSNGIVGWWSSPVGGILPSFAFWNRKVACRRTPLEGSVDYL